MCMRHRIDLMAGSSPYTISCNLERDGFKIFSLVRVMELRGYCRLSTGPRLGFAGIQIDLLILVGVSAFHSG